MLEMLAVVVEAEDWTQLKDEFGAPLSFVSYVTQPYPVGLGWSLTDLSHVLAHHHKFERGKFKDAVLARRLAAMREKVKKILKREDVVAAECEVVEELKPPRRPTKKEQASKVDSINLKPQGGTSADYLRSRLARDFPDIFARMKAGEFPSVRAAAIAAGIVKPTFIIPDEPAAAARRLLLHFQGDRLAQLIHELQARSRAETN
jgi:hypothetical protein